MEFQTQQAARKRDVVIWRMFKHDLNWRFLFQRWVASLIRLSDDAKSKLQKLEVGGAVIRTVIVISISVAAFLVFSFHQARAEDEHYNPQLLAELFGTYMAAALNNESGAVIKPDTGNQFPIKLNCVPQDLSDCSAVWNFVVSNIVQNDHVLLVKSDNPIVEIYWGNSENLDAQFDLKSATMGTGKEQKKITDVSDDQCRLLMVVGNSKVENAKIFISSEQSTKKQATCLAVQFFQAVGLTLPAKTNFKSAWASPLFGFDVISEEQLSAIKTGFAITEYIHMCELIVAGDDKVHLEQKLTPTSKCLAGLKGL